MIFVVDLLQDAAQSAKPNVIRSVQFEADDLFKVVERTRIMLTSRDFEATVDAFRISLVGKETIHQEDRGSTDASEPLSETHSMMSDALLFG